MKTDENVRTIFWISKYQKAIVYFQPRGSFRITEQNNQPTSNQPTYISDQNRPDQIRPNQPTNQLTNQPTNQHTYQARKDQTRPDQTN